ncbi:MAG: ABC transporter permease [Gammaproteobacteria bacterium]|nr:ABC transporter permease [Gammaproteobacteria bacterium]MBU1777339.1 ABC transporter permease [Gammaproteobacteria bacterium]
MTTQTRSSALITYTTWKALFLRAAVNSLSKGRVAWFWLLAEPIAHIVLLMWVFTVLRVRSIGGISTAIWVMAGMLAFFMFRRTAAQSMMGLKGGKSLFAFPQIRPVDPVLVSTGLEGFLMVVISIVLLAGAWLYGLAVIPVDPLAVIEAMFGLWLFGAGYGLISSVANELAPPVGLFLGFMLRPLYFLSGVIFPITFIPYPYREWALLNPLVHGLEATRLGFAPYYHVMPEMSISYLYGWALLTFFFGLALHVNYAERLARAK